METYYFFSFCIIVNGPSAKILSLFIPAFFFLFSFTFLFSNLKNRDSFRTIQFYGNHCAMFLLHVPLSLVYIQFIFDVLAALEEERKRRCMALGEAKSRERSDTWYTFLKILAQKNFVDINTKRREKR